MPRLRSRNGTGSRSKKKKKEPLGAPEHLARLRKKQCWIEADILMKQHDAHEAAKRRMKGRMGTPRQFLHESG